MIETLSILPMAPGTRSRRTDVLHRATPVMLKPKQRQTTLDQHLQQTRQQGPGALSSTRPPPLQAPSRQPRTLQQHKTHTTAPKQQQKPQQQKQHKQHKQQQTTPPSRQQTLFSFAVSPPTRNTFDTTDNAESMSSARPKRKAAVDADADARGGDAKRGKADATAGASASGGFSSVEGVGNIMSTVVGDEILEEALRVRPRLAVEILDFTKAPAAQKQKQPQQPHYTLVGQGPQAPKPAGKAEKPTKNSTASQQRPLSPLSPPALRSLAANNTTKSSANTHTTPSLPITQHSAPAAPKTRQQPPAASQKQARDKAGSSTTTTAPQTTTAAATGASTTQPRALKAAPEAEPHPASKSKEKLVNGIKHELKTLQLASSDAVAVASAPRECGRKLRSQEATRFKSELSAYFPEYDEVIGNEPKEEHLLNVDTPILFVEQIASHQIQNPALAAPLVASLRSNDRVAAAPSPVKGYGDKLFYDVFDSHVLDFTFLGSQYKNKGAVDPLPDTCFEANHKRAERTERSIRNTEKGRAQHEKDQIIRLLDGLQGPDWLRTMGVSGITESKKKAFEPARDHFIRGCRTILGKFRTWSLEEKRRKMEKDRAHAEEVKAREAAAASSSAPAEPRTKGRAKADTVGGKSRKRVAGKEVPNKKVARAKSTRDEAAAANEPADTDGDEAAEADDDDESIDNDSQPDSSDFDAVIALQLREEALARSRVASKLSQGPSASAGSKRRKSQRDASSPHDPSPLSEELKEAKEPKEVKSFFEKPYQREAALSRNRRKGRTVMAWGQPVPEPPQNEFSLPGEVVDKEKDGEPESKETGRRTRGSTRSANK